eukprot:5983672-Pleurochrysis_carterae.AAC.1
MEAELLVWVEAGLRMSEARSWRRAGPEESDLEGVDIWGSKALNGGRQMSEWIIARGCMQVCMRLRISACTKGSFGLARALLRAYEWRVRDGEKPCIHEE